MLFLIWVLGIVLPHFQSEPTIPQIAFNFGLVVAFFGSLYNILKFSNPTDSKIALGVILILTGGFIFGVAMMFSGHPIFYDIWSHLGLGPMLLKGKIYLFGDLAHLTFASKCSTNVLVGENICDPWGRIFNQNPQVVELFRFFHLTNTFLVGFFVLITLVAFLIFEVHRKRMDKLALSLFLCSPVFVLAIDRGNELITLTLILFGLNRLSKENQLNQILGSSFLILAAFLKIWPLILIAAILFVQWKTLRLVSKLSLITSLVYWGCRVELVKNIMKATQTGSPYGGSFGVKLFLSPNLGFPQRIFLISLSILLFFTLLKIGEGPLNSYVSSSAGSKSLKWILPFMLTYSGIWVLSDNFVYRMVIFIPLIVALSQENISEFTWPKIVLSSILTCGLTSRLATTISVSSALGAYFLYVVIRESLVRVPQFFVRTDS